MGSQIWKREDRSKPRNQGETGGGILNVGGFPDLHCATNPHDACS